MPDRHNCHDCHELGRRVVITTNDAERLAQRIRARHASRPERRRLTRLRTDADIAKQLYQIHRAGCDA